MVSDYISRHSLAYEGNHQSSIENKIKVIIPKEHAVILEEMQEATHQDRTLQLLLQRINNNDWIRFKENEDIKPFYEIRNELYEVNGLILRYNRIVPPSKLAKCNTRLAHENGHQGATRLKQMIREKC